MSLIRDEVDESNIVLIIIHYVYNCVKCRVLNVTEANMLS
jgi:hypothetical protein